ncbi:radical SAM (seleno)protein TrsS [Desulfovibrio sp. X2]|uniref:radical SAM (seleno)protein TrsS n=1 Tax=Desulfovibrio sp. X2 TaxID=941449 RepID=UPI000402FF59|nr:radical SAM (seleno)protein TrsS [Desulfovibrio sp. X2]
MTAETPGGTPGEEVLSETQSLCPVCLRRLPARRVLRGDAVFLERDCPEHGPFSVPVWRGGPDMRSWRRPKKPSAPLRPGPASDAGCPYDCGLCPDHGQHTCTAVLEITQRCNLGCPICFASSETADTPDPDLAFLAERLVRLRREAGQCNLQLSGGEPTVREDLPGIVSAAREAGFSFVQLNTNGLRLAREAGYARRLAEAGLVSVFLQFDGSDAACAALRGRPLLAEKLAAIDACAAAGLGVVLVPTLARGVNDRELGTILRLALSRAPTVRGVHFQPAASFGRYPWDTGTAGAGGLTLPEVLAGLAAQTEVPLAAEDFHPPCCEHELCSFSATFLRGPDGRLALLPEGGGSSCCSPREGEIFGAAPEAAEGARKSKSFTARQWAAPAPARPLTELSDDFDRFLAAAGSENRFTISCMAFQDAWSLDLERVRGCCIHVAGPESGLIPFCLYNLTAADGRTLYRGRAGRGRTGRDGIGRGGIGRGAAR